MGSTVAGTGLVGGSGFAGGGLPVTATVGTSVGSVIATLALIYVLAYLDLFEAADHDVEGVRETLIAAIIPLTLVFVTIVLFNVVGIVARTV